MSQSSRLLDLLRQGPVTCKRLASEGLFHHASQRLGEMKKKGYQIEFIKKPEWYDCEYKLIAEPQNGLNSNGKPCFTASDGQGQGLLGLGQETPLEQLVGGF